MHTTKQGQCLLDIAVQHAGTVEAAWGIALAGGFPMDWEPPPGTPVAVAVLKLEVVTYFLANGLEPANAIVIVVDGGEPGLQGVGYWIIETDFIVS